MRTPYLDALRRVLVIRAEGVKKERGNLGPVPCTLLDGMSTVNQTEDKPGILIISILACALCVENTYGVQDFFIIRNFSPS